MKFIDAMKSRYTTKVYDPSVKLSDVQIKELMEIVRLSPSSINSQPWKFVFISSGDLKNRLASASINNKQKVEDSSHLIVFMTHNSSEHFESEAAKYLSDGAIKYYRTQKKPRGEEYISTWFSSQVYIAFGVFMAACASMGIDATPMEGIEHDDYDKILEIDGYRTVVAAAIGMRDQADANQPSITLKRRREIDRVIEVR